MSRPEETGHYAESFDPDDVVWVDGVDYVGGWRRARDAGQALESALAAAGVDAAGLSWRADAGPDGSGRLSVMLSADAAERIARLLGAAGARWDRAG
ncbi:hypothetical protein ABZ714_33675 [Streptomyces sp. NPDC006798]|uniref:hypothetical protein n=1 Tax=Streptomyces sp. NPDC006798 TaxID=3155462 RepID=UPI0033F059C8